VYPVGSRVIVLPKTPNQPLVLFSNPWKKGPGGAAEFTGMAKAITKAKAGRSANDLCITKPPPLSPMHSDISGRTRKTKTPEHPW